MFKGRSVFVRPGWSFLLVACWSISSCVSVEEMFCAGVGYDDRDPPDASIGSTGQFVQLGMQSAGATALYDHHVNVFWGVNHDGVTSNTAQLPIIKLHSIGTSYQPGGGPSQLANGWFLLEILTFSVVPSKQNTLKAVAIWALSDTRETVGQFVHLKDTLCQGPMTDKMSIVPCSATPIFSVDNPSMFVYSRALDTSGSSDPGVQRIRVLWKADFSYCNFPSSFRFFVAMNQDTWTNSGLPSDFGLLTSGEFTPQIYRSAEIHPKFYGAATGLDDDPTNYPVGCDELAAGDSLDWLGQGLAAADPASSQDLIAHTLDYDVDKRWEMKLPGTPCGGSGGSATSPSFLPHLCQNRNINQRTVCKGRRDKGKGAGFTYFGGRCTYLVSHTSERVYAMSSQVPTCPPNPAADAVSDFSKDFYDHVDTDMVDEVNSLRGCGCPTTLPTKQDILGVNTVQRGNPNGRKAVNFPDTNEVKGCPLLTNMNKYSEFGLCKNSVAGKSVYTMRMWHGVTLLFVTQVLIPISCFMARFMKGRLSNPDMANRHFQNHVIPINAWWITHLYLLMPMICLYLTSYSVTRQYRVLGTSRLGLAAFHRTCGTVYFGLLGLLFVTGFLRPLHLSTRRCFIFFHWFCGYLLNTLGFALSLLTYLIPASPFSFRSHLEPGFENIINHLAPMILIGWFVVDTIYRIGVEVYVTRCNKRLLGTNASAAKYFPIHLPLPLEAYPDEAHQELEKLDRKIKRLFYIYILFCLISYTCVVMSMFFLRSVDVEGFGRMECTHNDKGEFLFGLPHLPKDEVLQWKDFCHVI